MKSNVQKTQQFKRERRKYRVSSRLRGDSNRPRLAVKKTLRHVFAQVIDDSKQNTLVAASDMDKDIKLLKLKTKVEISKAVGQLIASRCLEKKIKKVVFDRGESKYHGRVKALADGAREKGLQF